MIARQEAPTEVDWEEVARQEIHPRRFGLLQVFSLDGGRTLSPNECSFELQTNVSDASYHITKLKRSGILRLAHTVPVRGTFEHFYCLFDHPAADLFERLGLPMGNK
jgi:hypothetical protein